MAASDELEKRAIEELLKETDRARVRAETMGPAGWLKCPLRSTNKRFLLNTLRSTGMQRRTGESRAGQSTTRGRPSCESPDRSRDRSRTPPRDHRTPGDYSEHKHQHREKKQDKDKERNRHRDNKHWRRGEGGLDRDKNRR